MIKEKQIQKAKEVLLKYTLPDALKPQYDGMTAWEVSKLMLEAAERAEEIFHCPKCGNEVLEEVGLCQNCV